MTIMNYYRVIPADNSYRANKPLTYCHQEILQPGQIVEIELRSKKILGFIVGRTDKPIFATKPLSSVKSNLILPETSLKLFAAINQFYPGYPGAIGQLFCPAYLGKIKVADLETEINSNPKKLPPLNQDQRIAYDKINNTAGQAATFILHGETGSGKTRLYLELAKNKISAGQSVVILTPEISLTAPLAQQFIDVFGDKVRINHSNLTDKQRFSGWLNAQAATRPMIAIGPRSTLFMPVNNIGLIVIDEFHDQSYKQDSAPYYNAVRVASVLSKLANATYVLGSATPSVAEYFMAEQKNIPILRMTNQAVTNQPAKLNYRFVDLTRSQERSRYPLISNSLIESIKQRLADGKQSMIFINKRGSARSIICQNCGYRATCVNCDLPMTYHDDDHKSRCHTCGYQTAPPQNCPDCRSVDINFKSPGTKMIAQNLSRLFPRAKIVRYDKDNKKAERMENNYQSLISGEADIIVGTQLITKGHDLANLALVAILQAEAGLDFPDFNSEEKSYQLIKQLMGRVNRGHTPGLVLLQTFDPMNAVLKCAAQGDWQEFYKTQIKQRRQHGFPPFSHALKIEAVRKSRQSAQKTVSGLAETIKSQNNNLEILGPTPSFIEKKSGSYCWQIIVKSKNRGQLAEVAKNLRGNYKANLDPSNFL